LKNTRNHRKVEAAHPFFEVCATIRLPKGKQINVQKALESLLDSLGGGAECVDAIFIRFVRTTEKG
jgi:hypothetical protein